MNTGMLVESPVRRNSHAGFGGRPAETEQPKGRHRAAGRPYLATEALDDVRREVWNEARRQGNLQLARDLKGARFAVWKNPEVRHEALSRRAGMKGPRRWPVAAGWLKLRAA